MIQTKAFMTPRASSGEQAGYLALNSPGFKQILIVNELFLHEFLRNSHSNNIRLPIHVKYRSIVGMKTAPMEVQGVTIKNN